MYGLLDATDPLICSEQMSICLSDATCSAEECVQHATLPDLCVPQVANTEDDETGEQTLELCDVLDCYVGHFYPQSVMGAPEGGCGSLGSPATCQAYDVPSAVDGDDVLASDI